MTVMVDVEYASGPRGYYAVNDEEAGQYLQNLLKAGARRVLIVKLDDPEGGAGRAQRRRPPRPSLPSRKAQAE